MYAAFIITHTQYSLPSQCPKLAILRANLVERRQKRQNGLIGGKENNAVSPSRRVLKGSQPQYDNNATKNTNAEAGSKDMNMSNSLEGLDPNDFTASDFQSKPERHNNKKDSMASPPRTKALEPDDRHFNSSMDRSHTSRTQRYAMEDSDGEASVVDIKLIKCDNCNRSFAPKVYEKHFDSDGQPKCASATDKRPVFNSAKVCGLIN